MNESVLMRSSRSGIRFEFAASFIEVFCVAGACAVVCVVGVAAKTDSPPIHAFSPEIFLRKRLPKSTTTHAVRNILMEKVRKNMNY